MNARKLWNPRLKSILRQTPPTERGQMLYMVLMMMLAMLGTTAMVLDVGRVFIQYHQLVASTDAAALAGGEAMGQPNSTVSSTQAMATSYSSTTGDSNTFSDLNTVTTTVTPLCLTTLTAAGIPCFGAGAYNAVQVKQTETLPTYFANAFGTPGVTLNAIATASMSGAAGAPYNVAIVVDTTASMQDKDTSTACNTARLTCALAGVQVLLQELYPCAASQATCSVTSGVAANSVDRVALFTFPNMTTTTVSKEYDCSSTNPTINPYTFPAAAPTGTYVGTAPYSTSTTTGTGSSKKTTYAETDMTYEVTYGVGDAYGYMSDYRVSDTASTINTSSTLAEAVGAKSGCTGMADPGGQSTYYAGAIYAAQASLVAEQALHPGSQNALILVSDGDAEAGQANMTTVANPSYPNNPAATSNGLYPSWVNECGQAITAAQAAANAGTRVYAVAYGAESSGCSTDSPSTTPCLTMKGIASSAAYFYSDYAQSGTGVDKNCGGTGSTTTSINSIFQYIAASFTVSRLIPNNTQ
jgi:Putative Tad-like Flp pilus-assembly